MGKYEKIIRTLAEYNIIKRSIETELEPFKKKHKEIIEISDAIEREQIKQEKIKAELAQSKVPVKEAKNKSTNLKEKPKSNKEQLTPLTTRPKPSATQRQGTLSIPQKNSAKKRFQQRTCCAQSCPNL